MTGRKQRKVPLVKGLAGPKAEKSVNLALQGGGAHGAFTWGVLDEILADGRIAIEAITGASAGANLAAAACLANRDRANHPLRLQLLEVPAVDLTGAQLDRSVITDLGGSVEAAEADVSEVVAMYLAGADPTNPLASPLRADSLAGLPPAYLMAAELDPLVGDAHAYAARLLAEGTPASLFVAAGQTHESNSFSGISLAARHWEASVIAVLRTLHESPEADR